MSKTEKIAQHLNYLLHRSTPYYLSDSCVLRGGHFDNDERLYQKIKPILDAATEALDLQEIASAAKERRVADVSRPECSPEWWRQPHPWTTTHKLWVYCRNALEAVIKQDNDEHAAEYERYRLACEQGTALPPAE